jgi:beta-1,4-N-acetylglucosaminyltransferase
MFTLGGIKERKEMGNPRVLFVCGQGGHTSEMVRLIDSLGDKYTYYCIRARQDPLVLNSIHKSKIHIHQVTRPRYQPGKKHHVFFDLILSVVCLVESMFILQQIRPNLVITNGPWIGGIVGIATWLLRIHIIYIETAARVYTISLTGKVMRYIADDFFVQWPDLAERYPWTHYEGRLL